MIESSFLSSSPWDNDIFQDFGLIPDVSSFDFEELSCELDDESFKLSGSSSPLDICSSSSDYENLLIDDIDKLQTDSFVSDAFVNQLLEDNNNVIGFSDLDWLTDSSKQYNQTANDITKSDGRAFGNDPFEWILSTKLWSKMTPGDQLNTLHALSDIVTYHMGIREQMDVIRVIDPKAVISPEDKEFALDSTNLNDAKLRKIKDYIKKHRHHLQDPSHRSSFSSLEPTKKSNSTKLTSRKTNLNFSRTKRKQKKQKVIEETPEKRKRLKQTKKELKSGFFVYEKKMKLINPLEEDEDVNILE